jgi:hypothetical protein
MNMAVGPTASLCGGDDVIDHAGRPADVHMGAQRLSRQQRLEANHLSFTVIVRVKPIAFAPPQALQKRGVFGRANRVMQLIGYPAAVQVLELRENGRDADATGDQHMLAGDLVEAEQIHRMRNFQTAADHNPVVHEMRAAAAFFHPPHTDLIGVKLLRRTEQ